MMIFSRQMRLFGTMAPKIGKNAGITETLKPSNSKKWIGIMNTFKAYVEEIIGNKLIYA